MLFIGIIIGMFIVGIFIRHILLVSVGIQPFNPAEEPEYHMSCSKCRSLSTVYKTTPLDDLGIIRRSVTEVVCHSCGYTERWSVNSWKANDNI